MVTQSAMIFIETLLIMDFLKYEVPCINMGLSKIGDCCIP